MSYAGLKFFRPDSKNTEMMEMLATRGRGIPDSLRPKAPVTPKIKKSKKTKK